jgi:ABC-2 type transport system ATP-binding protein
MSGAVAAVRDANHDGDVADAVTTTGLEKRYGGVTALRECTISVPPGAVSALVGPNGAGKTTLLRLLAGLARPTGGDARVLGHPPGQDPEFLADVGYLAQDVPLWRRLSADEHVEVGRRLNRRWDGDGARARLRDLDVPLHRPVRTLSGGQRAQVALALALAKRPRLLLLDEPVAALDPLARRQFLAALAAAVADGDLTVIISSHLVSDLERVCDHLVLLAGSRPQVCGEIETIVAAHKVLTGPRRDVRDVEPGVVVVDATHSPRQSTLLARIDGPVLDPSWAVSDVGLEDVVLAYMAQGGPPAVRALHEARP